MSTGGMTPFQWGAGGQKLTPDQVEQSRRMAEALASSRIGRVAQNPWEGIAQIANAWSERGWREQAEEGDRAGQAELEQLLSSGDYMGALASGWGSASQNAVAQAMLQREMQLADRDALWAREDPLREAQLAGALLGNEAAALELEALRNPVREPEYLNVETADGQILTYDIADPDQRSAVDLLFSSGQARQVGLGAGDTAREQQISRLMETGIDRTVAIGIADGRYAIGPDENGRTRVWDLATGNTIAYAQGAPGSAAVGSVANSISVAPQAVDGFGGTFDAAGGAVDASLQTTLEQAAPNYSTIQPGTDVAAALGFEGTATGAVNNVTDYLFGTVPFDQQQQGSNALQNLRLQTNQALLDGFAGRTNVYTQEMIDDLAILPGMPINAAYDRAAQTKTLAEQQIARITNEVLNNPSGWTPAEVRDARNSVASLSALRDTYDALLRSIDQRHERDTGNRPPLETFMR